MQFKPFCNHLKVKVNKVLTFLKHTALFVRDEISSFALPTRNRNKRISLFVSN